MNTEVVKFISGEGGYHCNKPGDKDGEYVSVFDYEDMESKAERAEAEVARLTEERDYLYDGVNKALHPNGDGPKHPSGCDLVAYLKHDLFQLRAERDAAVARAEEAERSAKEEEAACEETMNERDELEDILGNIAACFGQEFSSAYGPESIEYDIRELKENRDLWQEKAEGWEKRARGAVAAKERAEEALRQCHTELANFQRLAHGKTEFPPTKGMELADAVLFGDHLPDAGKMVGEQPTVSKTESVERERRLESMVRRVALSHAEKAAS